MSSSTIRLRIGKAHQHTLAFTISLAAAALLVVLVVQSSQAQTYQVIHGFTDFGGDTYEPMAGLTIDAAGNLYGTAYLDGDHGHGFGSVFRLSPKGPGWVYTPLHVFHYSTTDGADPDARLIFGPDGSLYSTTASGGTYGVGTVYRIRPPSRACQSALCPWTVDLLYSFNTYVGFSPNGIIFDPAGNIFGTTFQGGPLGGMLYELSDNSWTFTLLYSFTDIDVFEPFAAPILDQSGNLYGTTSRAVYEFTTDGQLLVLHKFTNGEGYNIFGEVMFDKAGNLYGTSLSGGPAGGGTIFELSPSNGGWTLNILHSFASGGNCDGPVGHSSLSMDAAGNIYGTTACDGAYGWGNVFKLSPSNGSWTYTSLHDFCAGGYPCSDGARPWSNVVFDSKGNLYGTASEDGPGDGGVVWEITP